MGAWKMDGDGDEDGAEPGMVDARENRGGKGGKGGADVGLDGNGNGLEGLQVGPLGRRRTCRSSLRTTHANVRRRWHAHALLVACQLGFYGHPYTASGGAVVMRTHCDVRPAFLPVFCTCIDCTIFYWMYWGCIYDSRVEMDMYVFLLEL